MQSQAEITVYYDGSCPLCLREIAIYRRLKALAPINWVDVSSPEFASSTENLSQCDAMKRFHVADTRGQLSSGAAAFALLWQQYRGWRILGWLVSLPVIRTIAEAAYRGFLLLRPALQRLAKRL